MSDNQQPNPLAVILDNVHREMRDYAMEMIPDLPTSATFLEVSFSDGVTFQVDHADHTAILKIAARELRDMHGPRLRSAVHSAIQPLLPDQKESPSQEPSNE